MSSDVKAVEPVLPPGKHFAVTIGFREDYGGRARALLFRSAAFGRMGQPVTVLTHDDRANYAEYLEEMRDRGDIEDGVEVINMWDWLRENPLPGPSFERSIANFDPLPEGSDPAIDPGTSLGKAPRKRGDLVLSRSKKSPKGKAGQQVDYFREDGTLLASVKQIGRPREWSVVLCDAVGKPERGFRDADELFRAWLDALVGDSDAYFIVDAPQSADLMMDYHRPGITSAHVVHSSHLEPGADLGTSIIARRADVFQRLKDFDCVAILTKRQREEVVHDFGEWDGFRVVPNPVHLPKIPESTRRPHHLVVLASLIPRKRVDHAIRAVATHRETTGTPWTMDVFGSGPDRADLQKLIDELGVGEHIVLRGYHNRAREELTSATALLLTSDSEGSPLAVLEAMSAGCIPIAYDIRYGPSDVITDGVTGFIRRDGDIAGVTAALDTLSKMSPEEVEQMRDAAREATQQFEETAVVETWGRELRLARARRETLTAARARAARRRRIRSFPKRLAKAILRR